MPTKKNIAHSKPTQKRRKPGKRTAKKKLRWQKLWPPLVGAAIVVVTCWLLFRWYMSTRATPTAVPPSGYTVHGIDISHHQGDIDWELLRNRELPHATAVAPPRTRFSATRGGRPGRSLQEASRKTCREEGPPDNPARTRPSARWSQRNDK